MNATTLLYSTLIYLAPALYVIAMITLCYFAVTGSGSNAHNAAR